MSTRRIKRLKLPLDRSSQAYQKLARHAKLRYVCDSDPGILRRVTGRGFSYLLPSGKPIRNGRHLERIESLAIPPAWTDVWICRYANGHLQSTGRDERRRKQYLYHPRWSEVATLAKFQKMLEFGKLLPKIRRQVQADLARRPYDRRKVAALVVRLMDITALRVGNSEYARDNNSYGLTTLLNRHARVQGDLLLLAFRAKGGQLRRVTIRHAKLARLTRRCRQFPGSPLFQYQTPEGHAALTSEDVNSYLGGITAGVATAKDFRTWRASVNAAAQLYAAIDAASLHKRRRVVSHAIREAAELLGNTTTVCRKHYVHHGIVDAYLAGDFPRLCGNFLPGARKWYSREEQLLLHLLEKV